MAGETSCVVLLSGGMDSATLLALAKGNFDKVAALSIDYAQRHKRELDSAVALTKHYDVPHKILDISNINELIQGSSLTTDDVKVPHGHYADESMKLTVVPGRNTILLSIAAGWAVSMGFTDVAYAAHAGDHAIYPDCRPVYATAMARVFHVFHYWPLHLWVPFLNITKTDILRVGLENKVPYELTWTCYEGLEEACGSCGSCTERLEAFHDNEAVDPVKYRTN